MNELLASARAVHFAATIWLFGELVLACALSNWRGRDEPAGPGEALRRRLPSVARWSIAIGIASALAWLAAVAATMSGMPSAAGDRCVDAGGGSRRHLVRQGLDRARLPRLRIAAGIAAAKRRAQRLEGSRSGPSLRACTWQRSPGPGTPPPPRGRGAACRSSPTYFICSLPARGWVRSRHSCTCLARCNRSKARHRRPAAFPASRSYASSH